MQASSTTTLLLLAISAAVICDAVPVSKRQVWSGGALRRGDVGKCYKLNKKISDFCGYNTTFIKFPHRSTEDIDELYNRFSDWEALLSTGCSSHIGTFLCFHYFPFAQCDCDTEYFEDNKPQVVRPCKETCVAAKTAHCTNLVSIFLNRRCGSSPWAEHLDCEALESKEDTGLCAQGPINRLFSVANPVPDSTIENAKTSTDCSQTEEPPSQLVDIAVDMDESRCYALPSDIASFCGYNQTYIDLAKHKVPLVTDTFPELVGQFYHWRRLLNTGCSDYLATFLCFHYFPFAACDINNPTKPVPPHKVSGPCRETCIAAKSEQCTNDLQNVSDCQVRAFAAHLDCSQRPPANSGVACAHFEISRTWNGLPPVKPEPVICPTVSTTKEPTDATDYSETTEIPTTTEVAKPETTPSSSISTTEEKCSESCKYRTSATGGTFKRNLAYSYAVKVRITSIGRNSFEATVLKNYNLKTKNMKSLQCEGPPSFEESITVQTNLGCSISKAFPSLLAVGSEYLISGQTIEQNTLIIDCGKNALVSNWVPKYKKMENWVNNGNVARGC